MNDEKIKGVTTYRMSSIMKTASAITEQLVSGKHLYNPTYHECEIVLEIVMEAVKKSKNEFRRK